MVEEWKESLSTLSWSRVWHHMLLGGPELDKVESDSFHSSTIKENLLQIFKFLSPQRPEMGRAQWVDVSFQFNRTIAMFHGRDDLALSTSTYNLPPSPSPSLWGKKFKNL